LPFLERDFFLMFSAIAKKKNGRKQSKKIK